MTVDPSVLMSLTEKLGLSEIGIGMAYKPLRSRYRYRSGRLSAYARRQTVAHLFAETVL